MVLILMQSHLKLRVCYNLNVHFAVSIIFVMLEFFFVSVSSQKLSPRDILRTCRKMAVKCRCNVKYTDIPELYKSCHGIMNYWKIPHT